MPIAREIIDEPENYPALRASELADVFFKAVSPMPTAWRPQESRFDFKDKRFRGEKRVPQMAEARASDSSVAGRG